MKTFVAVWHFQLSSFFFHSYSLHKALPFLSLSLSLSETHSSTYSTTYWSYKEKVFNHLSSADPSSILASHQLLPQQLKHRCSQRFCEDVRLLLSGRHPAQ